MYSRVTIFIATSVFLRLASGQTVSLPSPAAPTYQAPSNEDRLKWFTFSTLGPPSLMGGVISAGWGTLRDTPVEYGPHWDGFAKRYGMRLTGVSTGNAMEAGLGALWGEDPRYPRAAGQPFKQRILNVVKMSVLANNRQGHLMPAYARYMATAGNNFLSNTWRPDSEATAGHAMLRTSIGVLGRMTGNAFLEFWPDVKARISRK